MCTTVSNGGAGGVDLGGGESQSGSCLFPKKPPASKKQRVPKRGPGVAELEKILREQGDHKKVANNSTSDVAVVPSPPPPLPPPPPAILFSSSPPPPPPLSSASKSAFRFPFSTLLGTNGSDQETAIPSPAFVQRRQQQSCPTMMNLFPHSSCSAATTEPPSNQTVFSRPFPVPWPDEDRPSMVGTKRPCPYTMHIPQIPSFRCQVPSYLPQVTESVSTFSPVSYYRPNPEPCDPNSRGQSSSYPNYDQSFRRCSNSKDPAAAEQQGGFVLLGCPTTTRITRQQQQHFNFNPSAPWQETKERRAGDGGSADGSLNRLPFYRFLIPEGEGEEEEEQQQQEGINQVETEFSFMRGDGLDLSLKL